MPPPGETQRARLYARAQHRHDALYAMLYPAALAAVQRYATLAQTRLQQFAVPTLRTPPLHLTAAGPIAQPGDSGPERFGLDDADRMMSVIDGTAAAWPAIIQHTLIPGLHAVLTAIPGDDAPLGMLDDPDVTSAIEGWRADWLAQRTQELLGIPDDVSGELRTELTRLAQTEGTNVWDAQQTAQTMLDQGYQTWANRAELIARTETVSANNQGALTAWSAMADASGAAATKTWIGGTRPTHSAVNGTTVGINEKFIVGDSEMNGPGDSAGGAAEVCNCKCTMSYEIMEGDAAGDSGTPASQDTPDAETLTAAATANTGVAVMAYLQTPDAEARAVDGGETPGDMHITLAYLAEPADQIDAGQRGDLELALGDALAEQMPLVGEAFAVAHFNPGTAGWDRDPAVVLLVQSAALAAAHDAVTGAINNAEGVSPSQTFPVWIPHVSVGYNLDPATVTPEAMGTVTFDRLVIGWGDDQSQLLPAPAAPPDAENQTGNIAGADEEDAPMVAAAQAFSAIGIKHTGTSDSAWDGGANEKRLGDNPTQAQLRAMYAWVDPDGDPKTKTAYKFPHHEVAGDGTVGDANLSACSTGIAALNGGRGGTKIPDADRRGVFNHLTGHLKDGGKKGDDLPTLTGAAVTTPAPPAGAPAANPTPPDPAAPADPQEPVESTGRTWSGPIADLGLPGSSDGRVVQPGGGIIRPLPQPISFQHKKDMGHDGSSVVGRILAVEDRGDMLWGHGDYLSDDNEDVARAIEQVDAGLGFISADLAPLAISFIDRTGQPIDPGTYEGDSEDVLLSLDEWEFGGATIISFAAFANARIANDQPPDPEDEAIEAVGGIPLMPEIGEFAGMEPAGPVLSEDGATITLTDGSSVGVGDTVAVPDQADGGGDLDTGTITGIDTSALTVDITLNPDGDGDADDDPNNPMTVTVPIADLMPAAPPEGPASDAAGAAPAPVAASLAVVEGDWDMALLASSYTDRYRSEFFDKRELLGPTPLTINEDTREIYGHFATYGECHIGKLQQTGRCVTMPTECDYESYFHLRPVETENGEVQVGLITVGTGHAHPRLGMRGAVEHYDHTGTQVAVVRAYDDAYGGQFTGQLIHGVDPAKVAELRRSGQLSGDWRTKAGKLQLIAALAVNVPGFPVRNGPRVGLVGDRQVSLVAAGMVTPEEHPDIILPSGKTMPRADWQELMAVALDAADRHDRRKQEFAAARAAALAELDTIDRFAFLRAKARAELALISA